MSEENVDTSEDDTSKDDTRKDEISLQQKQQSRFFSNVKFNVRLNLCVKTVLQVNEYKIYCYYYTPHL